MTVQLSLCQTWSEPKIAGFFTGSYLNVCHVLVELQSCDADVDVSVSLTGRGIIIRLASILLQSNAVTSTLSTGIEEGVSINFCLFEI